MKFTKKLFLIGCILFVASAYGANIPIPAAPKLAASSWILLDADSGRVLAEHEPQKRIEPASITKIMTAYLVYKALAENLIEDAEEVTISEKAWRTGGSKMFIEVNSKVKIADLIKGMVVQSGNDAAVALAEHLAGTEEAFVAQMNQQAAQLGLADTHFTNVTGMPHEDHYTSVRDIAILSQALINNYPQRYSLYATKKYKYNNIEQYNRNSLLFSDSSVDGIKTGHTKAAGYCLASSAKRESTRLIAVVMGTKSKTARAKYSQALLNYGFRYFETHKLYAKDEPIREFKVYKGKQNSVALKPIRDVYLTVRRGQYQNLKPSIENVPAPLVAPLAKQQLGELVVRLHDEKLTTVPLVAANEVPKANIFKRLWHSLLLLFVAA